MGHTQFSCAHCSLGARVCFHERRSARGRVAGTGAYSRSFAYARDFACRLPLGFASFTPAHTADPSLTLGISPADSHSASPRLRRRIQQILRLRSGFRLPTPTRLRLVHAAAYSRSFAYAQDFACRLPLGFASFTPPHTADPSLTLRISPADSHSASPRSRRRIQQILRLRSGFRLPTPTRL